MIQYESGILKCYHTCLEKVADSRQLERRLPVGGLVYGPGYHPFASLSMTAILSKCRGIQGIQGIQGIRGIAANAHTYRGMFKKAFAVANWSGDARWLRVSDGVASGCWDSSCDRSERGLGHLGQAGLLEGCRWGKLWTCLRRFRTVRTFGTGVISLVSGQGWVEVVLRYGTQVGGEPSCLSLS